MAISGYGCGKENVSENLTFSKKIRFLPLYFKKLGKIGNYGACSGDVASLTRSNSTTSSTQSVILQQQTQFLRKQRGNVPEVLLGLAFNGTTGFLTVEVIKGSCFRLVHFAIDWNCQIKLIKLDLQTF